MILINIVNVAFRRTIFVACIFWPLATTMVLTARAADNEAQTLFHQGLRLYLENNDLAAREVWEKAALLNHPKAMFNLSLMYQSGRLPDENRKLAMRWLKRAHSAGYRPATFQLANEILREQPNDAQALEWMHEAAQAGYAPAKLRLAAQGAFSEDKAFADSSTVERSSSELWNETQMRTFIRDQPSKTWTLQLSAFEQLSSVERFVLDHDLKEQVFWVKEEQRKNDLYKLMYGFFSSREAALRARQKLPESVQQFDPWVRNLKKIRSSEQ